MPSLNYWRVLARCLVRPRLLLCLIGAAWRFRRRGWYRRPPFLPVPAADYMHWRMHTAFGADAVVLGVTDLEAYLEWTVAMQKPHPSLARRRTWKHSSNS
jgi:hypothetical protein